jgi:hypothetical protein
VKINKRSTEKYYNARIKEIKTDKKKKPRTTLHLAHHKELEHQRSKGNQNLSLQKQEYNRSEMKNEMRNILTETKIGNFIELKEK